MYICCNSQNGKFSYGYASSPGKRSSMEDFYETRIDGVEGEIVGLFGVFDGISLSLSLSLHTHTHTHTHMHGKVDFSINILHRTYRFVSFCECAWTCVACWSYLCSCLMLETSWSDFVCCTMVLMYRFL